MPELSDEGYARQDFLAMCNGQEKFAAECFDAVDWQAPETWIDEQYRYNEWGWCEHCQQIYAMDGESRPCLSAARPHRKMKENRMNIQKVSAEPAEPGSIQPAPGFEARRQGL